MKKQGKIVLFIGVILSVLLAATGCSDGSEDAAPQTEAASAVVLSRSPSTPENLKSTVADGKIKLTWDTVDGAAGYIISLYDASTKQYTDLATVKKTSYTYTPEDDEQYEFQFGVYAYSETEGQKLYSPALAKVTAKTAEENLEMQSTMSVKMGTTAKMTAKPVPKNDAVTISWSSADESIATIDQDGIVYGVSPGKVEIYAAGSNGTRAVCVVSVKEEMTVPSGKLIAITFDDGPGMYTDELLDVLKEHNAKATFFMLGQNVSGYASAVKRMQEEGHELGNHSWDHASLTQLSTSDIKEEINKTNEAVYKASGAYPTVFRAPYGALNDKILELSKVPSILWSVDTMDWQTKDINYVKEQILDQAYDGAIILLHDIHKTSVQGFAAAVESLQEDGYTLVTVTELLGRNDNAPKAGVTYYDCK